MSSKNSKIKILLHFSLFLYLILYIYCDNDECANNCLKIEFECVNKDDQICSKKCRPKYGDDVNACYYCDYESNYYYINDNVCNSGCTGNFILDWNKECTSFEPLTDLYKMGDVYYKTCPIYSNQIGATNECKCENKFYKESFDGKTIFHCLSSVSECPPGKRYHNSDSKECIEGCTGTVYLYSANNICYKLENCNFFKEISATDKRCLSTCDVGEGFIDDNQSEPKKCLDSCSGDNSFYNHKSLYLYTYLEVF